MREIAERAGLSAGHVNDVINGRKAPSPAAAARIAQALTKSPADVDRARYYAEQLQSSRDFARRDAPAFVVQWLAAGAPSPPAWGNLPSAEPAVRRPVRGGRVRRPSGGARRTGGM